MNRNKNTYGKLRAVPYNRVSTDELVQKDALEVQIQESIECIEQMGWIMVDQYIDEGRTGTVTKGRDEYKRLMEDINTNNFDVIVIKSQDRLMRNTKDWYLFVDALVTNNKKLYIYLERKFYTPDDALITGIRAILAEEFSRDMSKKQNSRHRRRQELGNSAVITSSTWGYDKVNKSVVINEKEADVVRNIYNLCIQGYGSRSIAKELSNQGIVSRSGKQFAEVTVRKIIRNPLFKGVVVMNKTHFDFDTKKIIKNPPEEWIYHKNLVPAIVSEATWEQANQIMDKRSTVVKSDKFSERRQGLNLGKYDLSSKIICGMCDSTYWRRYRNTKKGQVVDWSCSEYVKSGRKFKSQNDTRGNNLKKIINNKGCDNRHIKDEDLMNLLQEVSIDIYGNQKDKIIEHANKILSNVLGENNCVDIHNKLITDKEKFLRQKNMLLDKLLDGTISDADFKMRNTDIDNKLKLIEQDLIHIEEAYNMANNVDLRLQDIKKCLEEKNTSVEVQTYKLIQHIDKIIVYEDFLEIYFDFLKNIKIGDKYLDENGNKKYQYVDSSIYSIPQTDTYHYDGQAIEFAVKFYV
jgi:DNA invertase Pin-like site-specific DNA recombinase